MGMLTCIVISQIPYQEALERGHVYLRVLKYNKYLGYRKGTVVRFIMPRMGTDPTWGFRWEANYLQEASKVERLLLDAGRLKFKEGR